MTVSYNPFDPAQVDHQDAVLTDLRHEARVAEVLPGVFFLTRYEDVVAVSRDAETFHQTPFRPLEEDTRPADMRHLGESNPPHHARVRKIFQSVLSPPRLRAVEPLVESVCGELVDAFASHSSADLIAELGRPLPAAVIGQLAGIPEADRGYLHEYSDHVVASTQEQDPVRRQVALDSLVDFDTRLLELIAERRRSSERPDDAITAFLDYRDDDGRSLSDEKILLHLSKDLITGGIDTTTHLVGNLFYDLLTTPGCYARVRDDRSLVAAAVEESLRHRPVVNVLFRQPAKDTVIGDTTIPAGSVVILGYASANRDEAVFEHPDDYDPGRGDVLRRQLGFGWGIHLCVGAPLARLEGAHVLNAVLDRIPEMRIAPGFEYERVRFFMMRGPVRLDVEIGPGG
jgi:cytochrome P450